MTDRFEQLTDDEVRALTDEEVSRWIDLEWAEYVELAGGSHEIAWAFLTKAYPSFPDDHPDLAERFNPMALPEEDGSGGAGMSIQTNAHHVYGIAVMPVAELDLKPDGKTYSRKIRIYQRDGETLTLVLFSDSREGLEVGMLPTGAEPEPPPTFMSYIGACTDGHVSMHS